MEVPIKFRTPHFRPSKGIGSKSRLVHRALPLAKADWVWETFSRGLERRIVEDGRGEWQRFYVKRGEIEVAE